MTLVKVQRPRRSSLMNIDRDIDSWFRGFFDDSFHQPQNNLWRPAMNAQDTEKEYILTYSIPGFEKEEINVNLQDNVLTVNAERAEEKKDETENYLYREIKRGSFERSVRLPEGAKTDKISAEYKSGILTLSIPKSEKALPKEIEVKIK